MHYIWLSKKKSYFGLVKTRAISLVVIYSLEILYRTDLLYGGEAIFCYDNLTCPYFVVKIK